MERRLQILLDESRYNRVAATARARGVSVAAVIREAIDRSLAPVDRRRGDAAREVLQAPPMDVGSVGELLAELDEIRAGR